MLVVVFRFISNLLIKSRVLGLLKAFGDNSHSRRGVMSSVVTIQVIKGMTFCRMTIVLLAKVC